MWMHSATPVALTDLESVHDPALADVSWGNKRVRSEAGKGSMLDLVRGTCDRGSMPPACAVARSGRPPAAPVDSGMAQVLTWLFSGGSSSVGGGDAASQDLSVSSMQVPTVFFC